MNNKNRLFEIISKVDSSFNVPIYKQLLKRIPFLKEYNIYEKSATRIGAQKIVNNSNVKVFFGEQMINFKQYNVISEFNYYTHQIRENIFYNFILKNKFYYSIPEELDDLTMTVYIQAINLLEEKLSYWKEIRLNENEVFDPTLLTQIINEINQNLFQFEEYVTKHNLKF